MSSKAEVYISFIVDALKSGEVGFEKIFKLLLTKFNITRPTFSKYWKIADQMFKDDLEIINKQKKDVYADGQVNIVTSQILSKQDIEKKLSQIINGELEVEKIIIISGQIKKIKTKPDIPDILKAIEIQSKMNGGFITKVENRNVDKDGNDIIPTPYLVFTKSEDELINELNAGT